MLKFRETLASWLCRLSACIYTKPVEAVSPPTNPNTTWTIPHDALYDRACELVTIVDTTFTSGYGEAKRHQVYSRLIKEFPSIPKRIISRTIEAAIEVT